MPLLDEDQKFDVVIDGTGLVESLVSAALSVSKKQILHLDINDYYGAYDGSLNLSQLSNRQESAQSPFFIDDAILPSDRKFLIDTHLRLLLADDVAVETLIKAGLSDHVSFLPVKAVKWFHNGTFESVPLSKAAIFQSASLSLFEKRSLMKFLTSQFSGQSLALQSAATVGHDRYHDSPNETHTPNVATHPNLWIDALKLSGLSDKLVKIVNHSLCLFESSKAAAAASFSVGQAKLGNYVKSIGKFHENSALLYPIYGSAEIPQAFCRKSAVHGGTFALKCGVRNSDDVITTTTDDKVTAAHLIKAEPGEGSISRMVVVIEADESACELLVMEIEGSVIFIFRIGQESACVPQGFEILHFSTIGDSAVLRKSAEIVIAGRKEFLHAEFTIPQSNLSPEILSHHFLFSAADVAKAKNIFENCAPGESWPF